MTNTNTNTNAQTDAARVPVIVWTGTIDTYRVVVWDKGNRVEAHAYMDLARQRARGFYSIWAAATLDNAGNLTRFPGAIRDEAAEDALLTLMTEVQASA